MQDNDGIAGIIGKRIMVAQLADDGETIYFDCEDGNSFRAYHMQDCCEHVRVWDIIGNLDSLPGQVVASAREEVLQEWPSDVPGQPSESFTWTIHTFVTEAATVSVRWLGESNGYYSESVYFERTHSPVS